MFGENNLKVYNIEQLGQIVFYKIEFTKNEKNIKEMYRCEITFYKNTLWTKNIIIDYEN